MQTPPADCNTSSPFTSPHPAKGLKSSRWASSTAPAGHHHHRYTGGPPGLATTTINPAVPVAPPAPGSDAPSGVRHGYELERFEKIAKRLSWKLLHLSAGFHRATAGPDEVDPAQRAHFEIMFKLDFYEFYMLLERALVHLLGVFDISVSRDAVGPAAAAGGLRGRQPGGGRGGAGGYGHAYHHNVLAALDSPDNVLHGVLGRGDVRWCLSKAKEMRNRWKYLDDQQAAPGGPGGPLPLEEYNVESILETIVNAFEVAYEVAKGKVVGETSEGSQQQQQQPQQQQEDWGFMVDAMDWEAV